MSDGNAEVEKVMSALWGLKVPTSDYNRIYSLVEDGLKWRAQQAASSDGQTALVEIAKFCELEAGRTRYVTKEGSWWEGHDAAMQKVAKHARDRAGGGGQ